MEDIDLSKYYVKQLEYWPQLELTAYMTSDPVVKARLLRQVELMKRPKTEKWTKLRDILRGGIRTGNINAVISAIRGEVDVVHWMKCPKESEALSKVLGDAVSTVLSYAVLHGRHQLIGCLVEAGADIDDPGNSNRTPLQYAVVLNDVECTRKLIKSGANIEATTTGKGEFTSMHLAVNEGKLECLKLLIQEGANIEATDLANYTPLHRAAMHNQLSAIEILLDAGCNRDARIHIGGTALHVAAMYNNKDAAELLVKKGFDPELKDPFGQTSIEKAEAHGNDSLAYWLLKSKKINLNEYNKDSSPNNESLLSTKQIKKTLYSEDIYHGENLQLFEKINSSSRNSSSMKDLKLIIPSQKSGYYQNIYEEGQTLLHVASRKGTFEAVKCLIEELAIYPNLKTYKGDLPADLAERAGYYNISQYLKNASKQKQLSINEKNQLYDKLLTVISSSDSDNVQDASRLLSQGAPLESYGGTRPSALALAILCNKVMIIELLLAAGAPLTVKHHGKTLLEVAWLSPGVTTRVKMIITIAYKSNLRWEAKYLIQGIEKEETPISNILLGVGNIPSQEIVYLKDCIEQVIEILCGETPWKARWDINVKDYADLQQEADCHIPNQQFVYSFLMGTAAKHNCKMAMFFLYQAGGRPYLRNGRGLTPLHEALDANFYELATVMVKNFGGSLYVPDFEGRSPKDLMPRHTCQQLEMEQVVAEFHQLDDSIISARSEVEKEEMKKTALVFICLYATLTKRWETDLCKWQDLYCYLSSLIQTKEVDKSKQNGYDIDYDWVALICQNLNMINKRSSDQHGDVDIGILDLLSCIDDLRNTIRKNKEILNIIQSDMNSKSKIITIDKILLKSVKIATENQFPSFLHLLLTIGKQRIDFKLNDIIQSLPLHHAASAGNFSAVVYLITACGALVNKKDRNKNTPMHLAYMNGYKHIGDFLCANQQNVKPMKNMAGQTPKMLKEAFSEYKKLYGILKDDNDNYKSMNLTEQIDGLSLTVKLLEHWFSKYKFMNFRNIMDMSIVDYGYGEAKCVLSLVTDFAKSVGDKIAEYNPLLKGSLCPVGSAADNVRLNAPDESDCTWILHWKNVTVHLDEMSKEDQNMKRYKHVIRAESDDTDIQRLLEGTNLLEEFYEQSVKAVSELVPNLDPRLSMILPGLKRIGCGVCISLAWAGTEYPMLIVNMDLVPAFKAVRPINFPHPPLTKSRVDPRLDSIYVVQTNIQAGEKRCSTTLEEQFVMQQLSSDQRLVFIIAKLLVSKLKTEKWASKLYKDRFKFFSTKQFKLPAPTGFLIKSAFFQELERVYNPDEWKENCIVDRLKSIFYSMCIEGDDKYSLYSGLVPSYFSSTTQPPAAGFMAPAIYRFLEDNEDELRKMENIDDADLESLAYMWNEALNKYYSQ